MKRVALAVTAAVMIGLTTGCVGESVHVASGDPSARPRHDLPATVAWHVGAPLGAHPTRERGASVVPVAASWDPAAAARLRVTVWGSGTCPPAGSEARVSEDGTSLHMSLRSNAANRGCTVDVRPATSVVTLPSGAALAQRTRIVVTDSAGKRWSVDVSR